MDLQGLLSFNAIGLKETNSIDPVSLDGVACSHGVTGHCEVSVQVRLPAVVGDREHERLSK